MEELMQHKALVAPVLTYLFHRLEARFDGRPTCWSSTRPGPSSTTRCSPPASANGSRPCARRTSPWCSPPSRWPTSSARRIAPALIESCPTRIFLPNDRALEPQAQSVYERFGLNARQIEILSLAAPKRDYYAQTARGNRLFELGLGPVALALCGASSPEDQRLIDRCLADGDAAGFAARFLRRQGPRLGRRPDGALDRTGRSGKPSRPQRASRTPASKIRARRRRRARSANRPVARWTPDDTATAATGSGPQTGPGNGRTGRRAPLPGLPGGPPLSERLSPFRVVAGKPRGGTP